MLQKHITSYLFITLIFFLPSIASAQNTLFAILVAIEQVLSSLFPLAIGIATLVFLWGMARFILNAGDEKGRQEGKQVMLWGVITLFVIVSVWGLVGFLGLLFGVNHGGSCAPPTIGTNNVYSC